jgi:3-methyl-2-oxobutanoate hydroxymethyltransferase
LSVPTIGIGAGVGCDGQVLVTPDMLGWTPGSVPKFVRQYANLQECVRSAIDRFRSDVQNGVFPDDRESFE